MFNLVVLTGRLTTDPELKITTTGISVTSFCIAVERRIKNADGDRETDFINIVAWRGTAKFVTKWFKKGDMIGIEGSIQTRNYEDKNGNKRTAFEVVANNVDFVAFKQHNENEAFQAVSDPLPALQENINADFNDDLPF